MALVDFLPVILFAAAVVILQGEFYPLFSKMQFAAFSSGGTMIIFILSVLFMLTMGYLSTKDFEQSYINWIAQGVNIVGEGLFLIGAVSLKRSGLKEFKF